MGRKKQPASKPPTTTNFATKHSKSECSGEECVTCHKTVNDEGVECKWCFNWEHKFCVGLTKNEYILLSKLSGKIMLYCSSCYPKVNDALAQYTQNCDSTLQNSPDWLTIIEDKLTRLSDQLESLVSHTPNLINVPGSQNTHVQEETLSYQANSKSMDVS